MSAATLSARLPSRIPLALTPRATTPEPATSAAVVRRSLLAVIAARRAAAAGAAPADPAATAAEDSFFVADLGVVYRQFRQWAQLLPGITPHYAVKCNPDPQVLQLLANLGANFDCASKEEIARVLALGVAPARVVYANTIKNPSYLRYARAVGVARMTFDNADELHKIAAAHPGAELLLRIVTDDSDAQCSLSNKFGAAPAATRPLLELALELGLRVVGVAFHIGSGGGNVAAYTSALLDAHRVFGEARAAGHDPRVLDIGGGFMPATFPAAAATVRAALRELDFGPRTQVIAEPGRFMVSGAFTLAASVIGRRLVAADRAMLYVSDGCYGNLNCVIYDHQEVTPRLVEESETAAGAAGAAAPMEASVWGPTCDGIDKITAHGAFPRAVEVGDWLAFDNVGAYTIAAATTFNGFNADTQVHYVCSDEHEDALDGSAVAAKVAQVAKPAAAQAALHG